LLERLDTMPATPPTACGICHKLLRSGRFVAIPGELGILSPAVWGVLCPAKESTSGAKASCMVTLAKILIEVAMHLLAKLLAALLYSRCRRRSVASHVRPPQAAPKRKTAGARASATCQTAELAHLAENQWGHDGRRGPTPVQCKTIPDHGRDWGRGHIDLRGRARHSLVALSSQRARRPSQIKIGVEAKATTGACANPQHAKPQKYTNLRRNSVRPRPSSGPSACLHTAQKPQSRSRWEPWPHASLASMPELSPRTTTILHRKRNSAATARKHRPEVHCRMDSACRSTNCQKRTSGPRCKLMGTLRRFSSRRATVIAERMSWRRTLAEEEADAVGRVEDEAATGRGGSAHQGHCLATACAFRGRDGSQEPWLGHAGIHIFRFGLHHRLLHSPALGTRRTRPAEDRGQSPGRRK